MTLLTYARRFTASIAAFALSRYSVDAIQAGALAPFAKAVDAALADVAAALAAGRAPAPLGELPELPAGQVSPLLRGRLTRLGRQLKTLHDAAARWVEPPSSRAEQRTVGREGAVLIIFAPNPLDHGPGQVSEWLKEPVSKTGKPATVSRVRIPPCPSKQCTPFAPAVRVAQAAVAGTRRILEPPSHLLPPSSRPPP